MKSLYYWTSIIFVSLFFLSCKKPKACIEPSVATANLGEEVSFNDCSENANNYNYDFGDGTVVKNEVPIHAYTVPGTYTITVRVSDKKDKRMNTATTSVSVRGIAVGDFTANNWILYKTVEGDNALPGVEVNEQAPGHEYQFTIDSLFINDGFSLPMANSFMLMGDRQFMINGDTYTVLRDHDKEIWYRTAAAGHFTKYFLKRS
jgi:PKD repeat protein